MKNRFLIICAVLFLSSCLAYGQEQASATKDFSENKQGCIQHPWQGKKVGYIGDSITDPNCYGDNIKKYWDFLKEWLGITPFVYGISGRQWDDVPRQAEKLKKEHGGEVDAILVFMGTNDYNSSVPIGEWFTEQEEQVLSAHGEMKKMVTRKKRTPVMTQDTYGCGEYIDAYVQAIKEAGNIWGIPVIDFNAVTGMNPMVEEQLIYFYDAGYDRLHPDTKGQERMARTLMYQLLALPATF